MTDVGNVAMKIAGRDAGQLCVVVEVLKEGYVMIDGATRRRKCNVRHLEFLEKNVKIKKGASSEEVKKALKDLGFKLPEVKKGKTKERKAKTVKTRKVGKAVEKSPEEKKVAKKKE